MGSSEGGEVMDRDVLFCQWEGPWREEGTWEPGGCCECEAGRGRQREEREAGDSRASGDPDILAQGPRGSGTQAGGRECWFLANMTVHSSFPENSRETPPAVQWADPWLPERYVPAPSLGIPRGKVSAYGTKLRVFFF